MTQRWSHALRQTVAAITSVSVLASGAPAGAQGLGDVGAYSGKADAGLTSTLNGATGAAGALGRLDTTLATPVIRSDDKARFGDKERQPHQEAHAPAPPKPLPLNDFQKFVKESTGQALPLFGADFFTQPQ
ncbi:MAG TPA: hypothetical protein VFH49_15425, partial [Aquabacterium sp.]|nr:hypothetical protein [Aquabacterium sp.]